MKHQQRHSGRDRTAKVDKWEVLAEVAVAREAFGLTNRELGVLQVLLSFLPEREISGAGAVVFPSNATICKRLNGMPCSTMRRHLARLVESGLILRRDSPNGKRYRRKRGEVQVAFGFDLAPLAARQGEIREGAEAARAAEAHAQVLREEAGLLRHDLASLAAYGRANCSGQANWGLYSDHAAMAGRTLRRKLSLRELEAAVAELRELVARIEADLAELLSPETSISDSQNEHHQQSPEEDSNLGMEGNLGDLAIGHELASSAGHSIRSLIRAYPEVTSFSENPIRSWDDLARLCQRLYPMMGISEAVWNEARRVLGARMSISVLVAMIQHFSEIRSPSGFLVHLTKKSGAGDLNFREVVDFLRKPGKAGVHNCEPDLLQDCSQL